MNQDNIEQLLERLEGSKFRSSFSLGLKERKLLHDKGAEIIQRHASQLLTARLAPASPANDGRQTPFRGHPVFIAQHATATCCRTCLGKWHKIPPGRVLTARELDYVVRVIMAWLERNENFS